MANLNLQARPHTKPPAPAAGVVIDLPAARLACGLLAAPLLGLAGPPAAASVVQIAVTGVAEARGHVRVELCTEETFLTTSCPYQGAAPAIPGATMVTIAEVPPGRYAVQAFQDGTDEGVVHQNFLGIPREKIGFSNDAPVRITGPRFRDASFLVGHAVERVSVRLRALLRRGN